MTTDTRTRGRPPQIVLLCGFAALGVLAGIAAKAADESGLTWAAELGTLPAAWVLAVALIGRCSPTLPLAAGRAATFFAAMTLAYYAWAVWVLGFGYEPGLVVTWLALSATAVAAVAAATWWATRRPGLVAGGLVALVAGTALVGGALRGLYLWWADSYPATALQPVQAVVEVVAVLVLTLLLPRHRSTRVWGLALVLPMWWLADRLIAVALYGTGILR
ncbi:hypothetical protein E4P39_04105 [Blastococcus sp. CT_GayMR19]|uniref:hypothetical protein n=1 Tax=Blastococcus sp. CT_GayMR19 TaxID=2559608 RepID=UPI001073E282|nr:hypothetical protein [Blastococcus sp. CT_GayMR19]TFV78400.1 hypothetical protein E4P39_04105 [Blastococcus sp. CT_GayMR19]